ncbi:hypothetical protein DL96DRAFT_372211 [Flagelloscypha sp. PMI_526]|nr:hypothetical protein DL96DRAFT_372211 [Flagelloscypha sp. PMI_526]
MDSSLPPPLPGYASLADIQPLVYVLVLNAAWASVLLAMFFFVIILSTPQIRQTPLFIMNVVAVVFGIVVGFVQVDRMADCILTSEPPANSILQRIPFASFMILPIYIDCILAARLYVVYPRSMTPSRRLILIFIPVVALKVFRSLNGVYFLVRYSQQLDRDPSVWEAFVEVWYETPCFKIEWLAGLADNCWSSTWFLMRLHHDVMKKGSSSEFIATAGSLRRVSNQLQKLFYLALSSFVFPCILNIVSVIICFKGSIFSGRYLPIFETSQYFQIVGVVLATIWVEKERSDQHSEPAYPTSSQPNLPFHATVERTSTCTSNSLPRGPTSHVEGQPGIGGVGIMHPDSLPPAPVEDIALK